MIAGLQKLTLLDYPGKVACTVFLQGCNYACPFCHNSGLLRHDAEPFMSDQALLDFLSTRKGLLDGVCITGGEPTLCPDLPQLLKHIKAMGFSVKLDTNGSRSAVLRRLVADGLVDYVAMDVKNGPDSYGRTVGVPGVRLSQIEDSLRFLISGSIPYELRTTLVRQLHDEASIEQMGRWLSTLVPGKQPERLFLQRFTDRESVAFSGLSCPEDTEIHRFSCILQPFVHKVCIRGE